MACEVRESADLIAETRRSGGAEKKYICPRCGTDVMVTGFTTHAEKTETWMRFHCGPLMIATTQRSLEVATCTACGKRLKAKPVELLRAA